MPRNILLMVVVVAGYVITTYAVDFIDGSVHFESALRTLVATVAAVLLLVAIKMYLNKREKTE